ncbi:FPPS synthase, partial [Pseudoatta argentina]
LMAVWPDVIRDIKEAIENCNIPDVAKWMEKVLQYNVPHGKMQAYFSIIDDIEDQSLFRRGQLCWYRYDDVGLVAVNDSFMLQSSIFYLIQKHFKGKDCYVKLLETTMKAAMGQSLDLLSTNFGNRPNLDLFTTNQYNSIIEFKTAYYSAEIKDQEMFREATTILTEIGCLFQIQDDYLDCYGDFEICGKDNTDIQEGKCTWFIVEALQRVTSQQRKILEECYGNLDREKVQRVKQLFSDLNLLDAYFKYEEETYNLIDVHIKQMSSGLPHNIFFDMLKNFYHRMS